MPIVETFRRYLGWCPNGQMMRTKSGGPGPGFGPANPATRAPGPAGIGGSGRPWELWYEHTQRGTLIIGSVGAALVLMVFMSVVFGFVWITGAVFLVLALALSIFSTLTVSICDDMLRMQFGPLPLIRKRWEIKEIVSAVPVTNPWYYGWGIRWTPYGPLYNVAGFKAVEVTLLSGKKFRIGTDEPEVLSRAILQAQEKKAKGKNLCS